MQKLLRLGLFVAAGYGTYEILRRAGLLDKAGQWLQDNVPEDVKTKVRDHIQQAKEQADHLKSQAGERYTNLKGQAQEQYESLKTRATDGYNTAREQAGSYAQQAGERLDHAKEVVTNKYNDLRGGQATSSKDAVQPPVAEEYESAHSTDASGVGQTITGPAGARMMRRPRSTAARCTTASAAA